MKAKNSTNKALSNYAGYLIDQLINANLKNWDGKELLLNSKFPTRTINKGVYKSYQSNKVRNKMITKINKLLDSGPIFHFRNYNNY